MSEKDLRPNLFDTEPEYAGPPPGGGRSGGKWIDRLAKLRERPGEWARWPENGQSKQAGTLKRSAAAGTYGPGTWEFTNRFVDGTSYIYARYLDENGSGS